jgi:hypothetical protein
MAGAALVAAWVAFKSGRRSVGRGRGRLEGKEGESEVEERMPREREEDGCDGGDEGMNGEERGGDVSEETTEDE